MNYPRTITPLVGFLTGVLAVLLCLLSPFGAALEYRLFDTFFEVRGPLTPPTDVAIIALDEESYRTLDVPLNAPWPRALHAQLLTALKAFQPKRVVFDVLFLGASSSAESDAALARALGTLPTVLGAEFASQTSESSSLLETILLPYGAAKNAAQQVGLVGLPLDGGVSRRFFSSSSELTRNLLPLSRAALAVTPFGEPQKSDFINFYGPPRTIATYSYAQVLDTEHPLPPELLRAKTLFVGLNLRTSTGDAKKDAYLTPYWRSGLTYGTEIHATASANIATGRWIRGLSERQILVTQAMAAGIGGAVLGTTTPMMGLPLLLGISLFLILFSYLAFLELTFLPLATVALIALPLAYLAVTLRWYFTTRFKQRALEKAFSLYLSPEMALRLARNPASPALGGKQIVATALFTDIADFTRIAERLSPAETAEMLNHYFTEILSAVFEHDGTVIKFIGDAVFALWGAPIEFQNHREKALAAGEALIAKVNHFNQQGRYPALTTRIGIHTGPMLVGNLGAAQRFDYTAIGDSVNLASRIEGLNKYLGTTLLASGETLPPEGRERFISFGRYRVKGKEHPIALYGIFADTPEAGSLRLWKCALTAIENNLSVPEVRASLASLADDSHFGVAAALWLRALGTAAVTDGALTLEGK